MPPPPPPAKRGGKKQLVGSTPSSATTTPKVSAPTSAQPPSSGQLRPASATSPAATTSSVAPQLLQGSPPSISAPPPRRVPYHEALVGQSVKVLATCGALLVQLTTSAKRPLPPDADPLLGVQFPLHSTHYRRTKEAIRSLRSVQARLVQQSAKLTGQAVARRVLLQGPKVGSKHVKQ